jgi:hypothetical protein
MEKNINEGAERSEHNGAKRQNQACLNFGLERHCENCATICD